MELTVQTVFPPVDVLVAGAGPGGITAAIMAARMGASVLLLEASTAPGGMGTQGLVSKWAPLTDKRQLLIHGLPLEIIRRYKEEAHVPEEKWDWIPIDPEALKRIYDRMLEEAGIRILYESRVCAVQKEGKTLTGVAAAGPNGLFFCPAREFIDATGDGTLAMLSGAEWEMADPSEVQAASLCFVISGYRKDKLGGVILSSNPKVGLWATILAEGHYPTLDKHFIPSYFGDDILVCNAGSLYNLDASDPDSRSKAYRDGREMAETYLRALKEYLPDAFRDAYITATAPLMGIRESRRIRCDYRLTIDDYLSRRSFPDEIGRNAYWIDIHVPGSDVESGSIHYGPGESHGIPFRCQLPKGLDNVLIAGRTIDSDRTIFGSLRVMPNCLATGTAAGAAAALAVQKNVTPREVPFEELKRELED